MQVYKYSNDILILFTPNLFNWQISDILGEAPKIWKKYPNFIWCYMVSSKKVWRFFQVFVTVSEYMNFNLKFHTSLQPSNVHPELHYILGRSRIELGHNHILNMWMPNLNNSILNSILVCIWNFRAVSRLFFFDRNASKRINLHRSRFLEMPALS